MERLEQPKNARSPITVGSPFKIAASILVHPSKRPVEMLVSLLGRVTRLIRVHPLNAPSPIASMVSGITNISSRASVPTPILFIETQLANEPLPIEVMLFGKRILTSLEQFANI